MLDQGVATKGLLFYLNVASAAVKPAAAHGGANVTMVSRWNLCLQIGAIADWVQVYVETGPGAGKSGWLLASCLSPV
jgi:hypothetical protein